MSRSARRAEGLPPAGLFGDVRLLVALFVAFRLVLLMAYQPMVVSGVERGLGAGGDTPYYFELASLVRDGFWPFRDWWHEFPPIASHLYVAVYLLVGGSQAAYVALFGVLMLAADTGNLLLVRALGARLHGGATGMALAWVYALLPAPLIFLWWNFEPLVVCLTLLALRAVLEGRDGRAGVLVGIGALLKFTPALLLGAVWRFRPPARAARLTAVALGLFALVYALFLARSAAMTLPSLTAQFGKASYETVWALIDGNLRTGNFGTVVSHLDPANAHVLYGNPPVIPGAVRLAVAGAIGLLAYARTRRFDRRGLVAFAALTTVIFFLQSQGWSPQWLAQLIPFVLLLFPSRDGILFLVVLTLLVFAEYPVLFVRTGDTGGEISGPLVLPYALVVTSRTLLLAGLGVALYRVLRQEPIPGEEP